MNNISVKFRDEKKSAYITKTKKEIAEVGRS